jgi:uncharacterized membrane protein
MGLGKMLASNIAGLISDASVLVDVFGVTVILAGILVAFLELIRNFMKHAHEPNRYDMIRIRIGKALLLGLEILVAADVIRTVALDPTLNNFLTLGVLIIIRTTLSWTLFVDIENRWPWQKTNP